MEIHFADATHTYDAKRIMAISSLIRNMVHDTGEKHIELSMIKRDDFDAVIDSHVAMMQHTEIEFCTPNSLDRFLGIVHDEEYLAYALAQHELICSDALCAQRWKIIDKCSKHEYIVLALHIMGTNADLASKVISELDNIALCEAALKICPGNVCKQAIFRAVRNDNVEYMRFAMQRFGTHAFFGIEVTALIQGASVRMLEFYFDKGHPEIIHGPTSNIVLTYTSRSACADIVASMKYLAENSDINFIVEVATDLDDASLTQMVDLRLIIDESFIEFDYEHIDLLTKLALEHNGHSCKLARRIAMKIIEHGDDADRMSAITPLYNTVEFPDAILDEMIAHNRLACIRIVMPFCRDDHLRHAALLAIKYWRIKAFALLGMHTFAQECTSIIEKFGRIKTFALLGMHAFAQECTSIIEKFWRYEDTSLAE